MSPLAQTLERDDMMALALYFSQKRWPDLQLPPAPADVAARAQRANVALGCTGCHQGNYQGEGTQPRLAGQWREYLQQSMLDFRTRKRGNNPGMTDLMLAISEEDIAACAEYLAGLRSEGSSSRSTIFSRTLSSAARSSARFPLLSVMARSAPRASSSSTTAARPSSAAVISAVRPRLSTASIGAPASSRSVIDLDRRAGAPRRPRGRPPTSARSGHCHRRAWRRRRRRAGGAR